LHLSISYHTFQLTSRGHLPQEAGKWGTHNYSTVYYQSLTTVPLLR
jgi:hypothetical protein